MTVMRALKICIAVALAALCTSTHGVVLSTSGRGQALIFPYFSTRATAEGTFNTLVSITNTTQFAKAVKVVLREGRAGKWLSEWDVYLAAGDMWTAGLVPDSAGLRLISADLSCTNPAIPADGFVISANNLTLTPDDGLGTGIDRLREGYVEVFEMGVLTGIAHVNAGWTTGRHCDALRAMSPYPGPLDPPNGGLGGGASLINVASARLFTYDAVALDSLASSPYFGSAQLDVVGFNAPAIDPVSVITTGGVTYRSRWTRPVDAVSAVLATIWIDGEYVLDRGTASRTDWVLTFPTRRYWLPPGCIGFYDYAQGRDDTVLAQNNFTLPPQPGNFACWSTTVATFLPAITPTPAVSIFASPNTTTYPLGMAEHGWARIDFPGGAAVPLETLALDHATGNTSSGRLLVFGPAVVGFAATTFDNGFLDCSGQRCKGNYGGTFKLRTMKALSFQ